MRSIAPNSQAAAHVAPDKADYYLADANYHALPTGYLCTPTLTPNYFDFILNWLILLLVVYLGIASLLLVGVYLDDRRRFDLASLLVGWWVLETLIFFAALGDLLAMACDPRYDGRSALPRFSIAQKYTVAFFVLAASVLVGTFSVLLVEKIDETRDIDWWLVFAPLIALFAGTLLLSACYSAAATPIVSADIRRRRRRTRHRR